MLGLGPGSLRNLGAGSVGKLECCFSVACPPVFSPGTLISAVQEEALSVSSAVHTIKLRKITACDHTFMEWITDYSADGQITLAPCLCAKTCPFLALNNVRGVVSAATRFWQPPAKSSWTPSSKSSMVRSFSPLSTWQLPRGSGVVCPCPGCCLSFDCS